MNSCVFIRVVSVARFGVASLLACILVLQSSTLAVAGSIPASFVDVAYGAHLRQKMDVWQAHADKPAPLVIYFHGGGWQAQDKSDIHEHLDVRAFLDAGISVASVNYRLLQDANAANVAPPVQWPLGDAARTVQFLRSKAGEWRFDKTRFAATGVSAGGCTALWLGMHDDLAEPQSADPIARESTRLFCVAAKAPVVSLAQSNCANGYRTASSARTRSASPE